MALTGSLEQRIPVKTPGAIMGPFVIARTSSELTQGLSSMDQAHMALSSRAENGVQAADASAIHQATERARAFAAGWLAHRARMERLVAEYEVLKSSDTPAVSCAQGRGPRS